MKFDIPFKLKSRHLLFVLAALALVLIAMGLAGALGAKIPQKMASDASNIVILCALGVLFYNRKLRSDEAKAKAAKDQLAEEKPAEAIEDDEANEDDRAPAGRD